MDHSKTTQLQLMPQPQAYPVKLTSRMEETNRRVRRITVMLLLPLVVSVANAATIRNQEFQVSIESKEGDLVCQILHLPSQTQLAAGSYDYPFPVVGTPEVALLPDGFSITGNLRGGIHFVQELRLPAGKSWLEEEITIKNQNAHTVALPQGRAGFVLPVRMNGPLPEGMLAGYRFSAIPFVREPMGGNNQRAEYSLAEILTQPRTSTLRSVERYMNRGNVWINYSHAEGSVETTFPEYASEGWCLENGKSGFVISKYSQAGMEWAILDRTSLAGNELGFRWGGFGIYQGDPEHGAWLKPGQSHRFGVTRLTAFQGGQTDGFYAFRAEMESRGMGCPKGFNAPVHWNELYDNKLWALGMGQQDLPENRAKHYTLADMKLEAAKAREIGCEALYLDPGWDTNFASKIWDHARLGPLADFTAMLKKDFGLSLSLHTPMSGWGNPSSYPEETLRLNLEGKRVNGSLCGSSRQYQDETVRRLLELAKGGANFFMLDGTMYHNECRDPAHGHEIPARREAHVAALNDIVRRVHSSYPDIQIEMHDQVTGGSRLRYVPIYYGYGNGGYDTVWGFELMWNPMRDLVDGHSIALYYYNLAYSIPLYLHIDLRTDTAQGLMFWWNASTVRHLGIGGTHKDPAVQKMHHQSMATYMRLKPFFASGTFYGIDELTHVHRHPALSAAVVNCFNLTEHPVVRRIHFDPVRFKLEPRRDYRITGAKVTEAAEAFELEIEIPAYGHSLIEIN